MLKPTSLVNIRINQSVQQQREYKANSEDVALTMAGIIANITKADTTVSTVQSIATSLKEKYYNKFKQNDIVYDASIAPEGTDPSKILDDASFYVPVAEKLGDRVSYVKIGGVIREKDEPIKMSIGNSAFIKAPLWKIDTDNGVLKVAVPYLCASADTSSGLCKVIVGGIVYEVPTFEQLDGNPALIISAITTEKREGCVGAIEKSGSRIDVAIGHGAQLSGLVLRTASGIDITDPSVPIYIIKDNGQVSMTTPEKCNGLDVTYAWYSIPYKNAPVDESADGKVVETKRHIVVPGYGAIEISIRATTVYTEK